MYADSQMDASKCARSRHLPVRNQRSGHV